MSIQINTVNLPNGQTSIEITDEGNPDGHVQELGELKKTSSDIPQDLIDECEAMAEKTERTMFIFDTATRALINSMKKDLSTQQKRDILIDDIIDDSDYYIGGAEEFHDMPSRSAYYDTESKEIGQYGRYDRAMQFIKIMGFEPGYANYGREMEQSFFIQRPRVILRLQPNLTITMTYQGEDGELSMRGYFSKTEIYRFLHTIPDKDMLPFLRDQKINEIFDENI